MEEDRIVTSMDFFVAEEIISQSEKEDILDYLQGKALLIASSDEYTIDDGECIKH